MSIFRCCLMLVLICCMGQSTIGGLGLMGSILELKLDCKVYGDDLRCCGIPRSELRHQLTDSSPTENQGSGPCHSPALLALSNMCSSVVNSQKAGGSKMVVLQSRYMTVCYGKYWKMMRTMFGKFRVHEAEGTTIIPNYDGVGNPPPRKLPF
ncbi:hypothetical protein K438DRAFT_1760980 [Mycena galopus ATCC 62051]|nr:hypothetical protein K438DRAFT_1760980 [Mycena galopus ATCC 62051]